MSARRKRLPLTPNPMLPGSGPRLVVAHALSLIPVGASLGDWLAAVTPEGRWSDMSDDDLAACILGHAHVFLTEWEHEHRKARRGSERT